MEIREKMKMAELNQQFSSINIRYLKQRQEDMDGCKKSVVVAVGYISSSSSSVGRKKETSQEGDQV